MDSKCSIGEQLGDTDRCHKTIYSKTRGLTNIASLTNEIQELLRLRTEATFEINCTICRHHKATFVTRYETLRKQCSDPFIMHQK